MADLRLVPPLTPGERERAEVAEIAAMNRRIRAAILAQPPVAEAMTVAREALDRGHNEREALILLVAVLEDSRGEPVNCDPGGE